MVNTCWVYSVISSPCHCLIVMWSWVPWRREILPFFPYSVLPWAEPCSCSININWINQLPQHRCTHLSALCFLPATNTTCAFSCPCRNIGPTPSGPAQTFYSCALSRQTPFAKYALRSVRPASPCTHSLCNTYTQLWGALQLPLSLPPPMFPDPSKGLRRMRSTPHATSGAGFLITAYALFCCWDQPSLCREKGIPVILMPHNQVTYHKSGVAGLCFHSDHSRWYRNVASHISLGALGCGCNSALHWWFQSLKNHEAIKIFIWTPWSTYFMHKM